MGRASRAPTPSSHTDMQNHHQTKRTKRVNVPLWGLCFILCSQLSYASELRVLIVDGFNNHHWRATTTAVTSILKQDQNLKVEVSTVPTAHTEQWKKWCPTFTDYDVIIQNTNDISKKGSWPTPAQKALERYLQEGGGMVGLHSANNAFLHWEEYNQMIGLGWRKRDFGPSVHIQDERVITIPTGQGENTGHGPRIDALVTRLGDHPMHQGLPRSWLAADLEVYRYPRGPAKNLTILSYAQEPKTGKNFPIEWLVNYGKGRVYCSTYGHYWHNEENTPRGIRCLAFQELLRRALYYVAGRAVPQGAAFPTPQATALAPE